VAKRLAVPGAFLVVAAFVVVTTILGIALALGMAPTAGAQAPSAQHSLTVKFDYNFNFTPACSATVTKSCVQQFNVYDISGGTKNRIMLFSVPVPPGAKGIVKGITQTSQQLVFEPGKHFIGVTAQMPNGKESNPASCQTSVQINP
jgi:hypothetical protein